MTVYVTTWLFSRGIRCFEGCEEKVVRGVRHVSKPGFWGTLGRDSFLTEEEARVDALRRVEKARKALRKRLGVLDAMQTEGFPIKPW